MRPTTNEYVIEIGKSDEAFMICWMNIQTYAKLTNRAPRLGDFVPTDEEGNVLEKPDIHSLDHSIAVALNNEYQAAKDKVIFAGDWKVEPLLGGAVDIFNKEQDWKVRFDEYGDVIVIAYGKYPYKLTRIEDLPREIEFKNGVI